MGYLHGVEIKEIKSGAVVIRTVATAIIGIVGIAIKGDAEPTLIASLDEAKTKYGEDVGGTTIISALKTIFNQGGATCIVVNVGDPTKMATATDSATNKIKLIGGKYATQIHQQSIDTATAGLVDFRTDVINGIKKLKTTESLFGVKAKIILAPGFSHLTEVFQTMVSMAEKLKAMAIVDISAESIADAITAKGTTYGTQSRRVVVCFPNVIVFNENDNANQEAAYSQFVAGAIANKDATDGYWFSPSNTELNGITRTKVQLYSSLHDQQADTNLLNGQGIVTIFRKFGTGFKVWGNWTAAFPTNADLKFQIAASRVADVIDESIQEASMSFVDQPITTALIDYVKGTVNNFLNTLKTRGAIVDGSCIYDKNLNSTNDLAQGKIVFSYSFAPSPSLDTLTFQSYVDVNLLKALL